MAAVSYLNQAQQHVLRALATLIARRSVGALPSEIADTIDTLPSNTTRDLANLHQAGFARPEDGRWHSAFPAATGTGAPDRRAAQRRHKSLRRLPESVG